MGDAAAATAAAGETGEKMTSDEPAAIASAVAVVPALAISSGAEVVADAATVRTMEDTVSELLRPMLRDWLDANMPRIVEKALKVEMASVLPAITTVLCG